MDRQPPTEPPPPEVPTPPEVDPFDDEQPGGPGFGDAQTGEPPPGPEPGRGHPGGTDV